MLLKKKVALITGAGVGIGKGIARKFAEEGAILIVNDINADTGQETADEITKNNGTADFVHGDTSSAADAKNMVDFAVQKYGRLDVLVNNAAIEVVKPFLETTEQELESLMQVNIKGVFLVGQQAGLQMVKQGGGSIINLSSVGGLIVAPLLAGYCATKHGVIGLTKTMALELRTNNIRVNALCPAFIDTPMIERTAKIYSAANIDVASLTAQMQVRLGKVEEVASVAVFLASDQSSFVNGTAIPIDNAFTAS
ncbi:oxidoreductase, short chain dehydrogenase/reductase family protein [delta proteobacterium NaphS2]|nr:oxidoreductase, short chain dehydrogenase/reductase family protein [delta proteobacterium NaphS2]